MNEKLQNQLAEVIKKAVEAGENVVDFAQKQVPDVVEQLLKWKMAEALFFSVLGMALIAISVRAAVIVLKESKRPFNDRADEVIAIATACGIVSGIVGIIVFAFNFLTVIQVAVAPKIFLLEYAAKLIK